MAAPSVRNVANSGNASSGTSFVVTAPTNQDGDLIVVGIQWDAASGSPALTPPSGWTNLSSQIDVANGSEFAVYYRTASSEPSTWTWTANVAGQYSAQAISVKDWLALDSTANGIAGTSGTNVVAGGVSSTVDGALLLMLVGYRGGVNTGWTAGNPAGMNLNAGSSFSVVSAAAADLLLGGAGATGSKTFVSTQNQTKSWYQTITIKPKTSGSGALKLPFPVMTASGTHTDIQATAALKLPFPYMTAVGKHTDIQGSSALKLPFPYTTAVGDAHVPPLGTAALKLPFPYMTTVGAMRMRGVGALTLPFPTMTGVAKAKAIASSSLKLPFPTITGVGRHFGPGYFRPLPGAGRFTRPLPGTGSYHKPQRGA